jgi:hypothetical protein
MPTMVDQKCKCCKKEFQARSADIKRGWGLYCSKSCKAKIQEKKNGQHAAYLGGRGVSNLHPERLKHYDRTGHLDDDDDYDTHPFSSDALGQW